MRIKLLFILAAAITCISSAIWYIVPDSIHLLSFSGILFLKGEVWRIITYIFTHTSKTHLFENIVALAAVSFLGYEFGLKEKEFLWYFFAASIIIALTSIAIVPTFIIAGASLGIYGVIGALSIKGSSFISKLTLIPIFAVSIFFKDIITVVTCPACEINAMQTAFHLSGFIAGIFLVTIPTKFKNKKNILQEKT